MRKSNPKKEENERANFGGMVAILLLTLVAVLITALSKKGTGGYLSGHNGVLMFIAASLYLGILRRLNPKQIIHDLQVKKYQNDLRYYDFWKLLHLIWIILGLLLLFFVDFSVILFFKPAMLIILLLIHLALNAYIGKKL